MSDRTLTALFAQKSDAERARDDLKAAGLGHDIDIHDQGGSATDKSGGLWDSVKDFFGGHEDAHAYGEGLRRGHYLLTVKADEADADPVSQVLERSNAIDFDQAQQGWRNEGWAPPAAGLDLGGSRTDADRTRADLGGADAARGRDDGADEQVIPIVEERLRVGKREVERGGVRVRSYVVETPVNEQVNLREEHVSLQRRAVDEPVAAADADRLFQERDIALTETAEEAVIAKDAVVREELVLRKDATERTQEINDSVRRTEVEVEDLDRRDANSTQPRGA